MSGVASKPLKSLGAIKKEFGISLEKVREWVDAGAPITVIRDSHGKPQGYKSEFITLLHWSSGYERERSA